MRAFPSAAGRPALATLVLLTTLSGAIALPAAYADPGPDHLKQKQHDVQSQIQATQADAEDASKQVTKATSMLADAETQLSAAQAALVSAQEHASLVAGQLSDAQALDAQMQQALTTAQANLDAAKADVVAGQAALDAQQATVKSTVVDLYQQGPAQLIAINGYLHSQTPADLTRKMEYANTLVEDQDAAFDDLHAAQVALEAKRADVKTLEVAAADQADQAAQQLLAVQDLQAKADDAATAAQGAQDQVTATVAAREKAKRKAERARRDDLAELAALKKQEDRIKQQIIAAAAADKTTGYVGADDGFLLPPVTGPVTSPFGYRIHPIYGYWGLHDGTDFGVSCGEGMRASADGTVISRYWSDVYGNRLYLDVGKVNGHNITVVYNHATSYDVNVGDHVKRGQVVGYVGSTGWSTGCHLHFTVLQDGTAVDPMGYL